MDIKTARRQEQVICKLAAEGLDITAPWVEIEAALSECVGRTAMLRTARAMKDDAEVTSR